MTKYLVSGPHPGHHLTQQVLTARPACRFSPPVLCVSPTQVHHSQGWAVGDENLCVGGDFLPDSPQLTSPCQVEGGVWEPRLPGTPVELDAHQLERFVLQVDTVGQQGFHLSYALRSLLSTQLSISKFHISDLGNVLVWKGADLFTEQLIALFKFSFSPTWSI